MRVLLIAGSPRDAELIATTLAARGCEVHVVAHGLTGLGVLERERPELVLLDPLVPDVDGFGLCARIRESSGVPIIMVSQRASQTDVVRGLGAGADDYVPSTVSGDELLARLIAVRRRAGASAAPLTAGDLSVDPTQRRVAVRGAEVHLTPVEYRLLYYLISHAGMILSVGELAAWTWGRHARDQSARLQTTIRRLRCKLEVDPAEPRYVLTRRGVGYLLATLRST